MGMASAVPAAIIGLALAADGAVDNRLEAATR
jgi:hypothetical protein